MKCKLCGSDIKKGVCTFCGQPMSYEQELEEFKEVQMPEEENIFLESEEKDDTYKYSEHYERRYVHSELKGMDASINSLMVKIIIILLSMMMLFAMYTYKQNKDAASEENIQSDMQIGETYTVSFMYLDSNTSEYLTEKTEYTFTTTEENHTLSVEEILFGDEQESELPII